MGKFTCVAGSCISKHPQTATYYLVGALDPLPMKLVFFQIQVKQLTASSRWVFYSESRNMLAHIFAGKFLLVWSSSLKKITITTSAAAAAKTPRDLSISQETVQFFPGVILWR